MNTKEVMSLNLKTISSFTLQGSMGGDGLHPEEDKRPQFSQLEEVIHFRWKWYAYDIPHVVN